ncbi:hypothetical protein [Roseovarius salis]|uniref:hypothetical protein n=1 Tax=Roseovarius salis TaxID=3376063 RepID=UPI0037C64DDE
MTLQHTTKTPPDRRAVAPRRPDLAAMAMAGLLPVDLVLEHLLDRIEEGRP